MTFYLVLGAVLFLAGIYVGVELTLDILDRLYRQGEDDDDGDGEDDDEDDEAVTLAPKVPKEGDRASFS